MILIIDLESTCWDVNNMEATNEEKEKQWTEMEIIEIGATLLGMDNDKGKRSLEIIKSFSQFVKPVKNPILSDFCRNLTTITQENVDGASEFPEALSAFVCVVEKCLGGGSIEKVIWASWGNYDRKQLLHDCKYHKIEYPFGAHWNIKNAFAKSRGWKKHCGLAKAVATVGLEFEGTAHRGIDDTINAANVVEKQLSDEYFNHIKGYINYK